MPNPSEYRHIAAWGRRVGSYPAYIRGEQERAAEQNAPLNAIYRNESRKYWVVATEVENAAARAYLIEQCGSLLPPEPVTPETVYGRIYWADFLIPAAPLELKRRLYFAREETRDEAVYEATQNGCSIVAKGVEPLFNASRAAAEIAKEKASV